MLCIYHNADQDGFCSAAIVKYTNPTCELWGVDYNDVLPPKDILDKHNEIVMVDFSYKKDDMIYLAKNFKLTYIDHHKTAIANMEDIIKNEKVLCVMDTSKAACQLAWEFYFPNKMPRAVELCAKHDLWIHDSDDVWAFQYGMRILPGGIDPKNVVAFHLWELLFTDGIDINTILESGFKIYSWENIKNTEIAMKNSFEFSYRGIKFLAINSVGIGSAAVDGVFDPEKHDAVLVFGYIGDRWKVSMYAHTSKKVDMDFSSIAKEYGGGGHKNAAGFYCDKIPGWIIKEN